MRESPVDNDLECAMNALRVPAASYRTAGPLDRAPTSSGPSIAPNTRQKTLALGAKVTVRNLVRRVVDKDSSSDQIAPISMGETSRGSPP